MKSIQKYVGLDVSKEKIAVAIAEEGREVPRYWGTIAHKPKRFTNLSNNYPKQIQHLRFVMRLALPGMSFIAGCFL
jgi:hypothetical protein